MNLYEIEHEIRRLTDEIDAWAEEHGGDITDCPALTALDSLSIDRERKVLSLGCLILEEQAEAKAVKAEIDRLTKRYKARTREAERLAKWVQSNIKPGEKFKDARVAVTLRNSTATIVEIPAEELPLVYVRVKTETAPDKKAIGEALRAGECIPGCRLESRWNLSIE